IPERLQLRCDNDSVTPSVLATNVETAMSGRRNEALPESGQVRRLQWYLLVGLVVVGGTLLAVGALVYLAGLPTPAVVGPGL
ncbi:MAG: hypothetical protein ABEJ74_05875, partial [Haloferacaceae archaeon]